MKSNKKNLTIYIVVVVAIITAVVMLNACTKTPAVNEDTVYVEQLDTQDDSNVDSMLLGAAAGYVVGSTINSANNQSRYPKAQVVSVKSRPLPKTTLKPKASKTSVTKRKIKSTSRGKSR